MDGVILSDTILYGGDELQYRKIMWNHSNGYYMADSIPRACIRKIDTDFAAQGKLSGPPSGSIRQWYAVDYVGVTVRAWSWADAVGKLAKLLETD